MKIALQQVHDISGHDSFKYSVDIKEELMKLNRYRDYQNGYKRINNLRKRFDLSDRNWDDLINGRDNIPTSTYRDVLTYLRHLSPDEDTDKTETDIAIDNLKKELYNHERILV